MEFHAFYMYVYTHIISYVCKIGFRVIAEVSTPGEDYEEKATVEEPHSDKHTSIEVEESTRDGMYM